MSPRIKQDPASLHWCCERMSRVRTTLCAHRRPRRAGLDLPRTPAGASGTVEQCQPQSTYPDTCYFQGNSNFPVGSPGHMVFMADSGHLPGRPQGAPRTTQQLFCPDRDT